MRPSLPKTRKKPPASLSSTEMPILLIPILRSIATCHPVRIGAKQLYCQRLFTGIKTQQSVSVAMQHRAGSHHLGIQQRMPADQAQKITRMTVGVTHHRRYGYSTIQHIPILPEADQYNETPE